MLRLAQLYETGEAAVPNLIEAAKWYRAAAETGDAEAQFCLGRLYARGDGVPQELGEAAKWFEKAAEQGIAAAQVNIADVSICKGPASRATRTRRRSGIGGRPSRA